jgi:UDP-2-acetamido-2-deoxy-ribo-hexuluronate aminotransferase
MISFCDLKKQYQAYQDDIDSAVKSVLNSSVFIGGLEVQNLEQELAHFSSVKNVITCGNGSDAIYLSLLALEVQKGDEIIVPDFTFYATAEMVSHVGAIPVFADINLETYNIASECIESLITPKTKGIIPVSLYGQMPDIQRINKLAEKYGLWVLEDGAQSFGASIHQKPSCSLSGIATTSFYPSKPLGCYGDGGAIFVKDEKLANKVRMLANHGSNERDKYKYVGLNSRLDSIQAAVLNVKLKYFRQELKRRNVNASLYTEELKAYVQTPMVLKGYISTWAQYTIRLSSSIERDKVKSYLTAKGVPSTIYYPKPLHQQEAFSNLHTPDTQCPNALEASKTVLSLPIHGIQTQEEVLEVCKVVKESLEC